MTADCSTLVLSDVFLVCYVMQCIDGFLCSSFPAMVTLVTVCMWYFNVAYMLYCKLQLLLRYGDTCDSCAPEETPNGSRLLQLVKESFDIHLISPFIYSPDISSFEFVIHLVYPSDITLHIESKWNLYQHFLI